LIRQSFKAVNRALSSLHEGSLQITRTIPLYKTIDCMNIWHPQKFDHFSVRSPTTLTTLFMREAFLNQAFCIHSFLSFFPYSFFYGGRGGGAKKVAF